MNTIKIFSKIRCLTIAIIFISFASYCQTNNRIYATIEDYKNDTPLNGYEVIENSWANVFRHETIKTKKNGVVEKTNVTELPADFFTYNDFLIRVFKNSCYIVIAEGQLCYYALYQEQATQYYSEKISGDIVKFKDKILEDYLEKYYLLEDYKKDKPKRQFSDSANDVLNNRVKWKKKYFDLVNEKFK